MKLYKKKIKKYRNLIQNYYVRESAVQNVVSQCKEIHIWQEHMCSSYFEFLYEQCKFIKKRWWMLQGGLLLILWFLLYDLDSMESIGRIMGAFSVFFSILIIPEIWKNRRFSAFEIEKASYYSLRQICAARLLLFAIADMMMVTVFFGLVVVTLQIPLSSVVTNFLIPFNVSSGVCFHLLCKKGVDMEYIAVCLCMAFVIVWSMIVANDVIYYVIVEPLWLALILISFGYLIFCVHKYQQECELIWENNSNGIGI